MGNKRNNSKVENGRKIEKFTTEVEILKQLQKQNEDRFKQYEIQLDKLSTDLDIVKKEVTEIKTLINVLINKLLEQTQEKLQNNSKEISELMNRVAGLEAQEKFSKFILSFSISVLSLLIAIGMLIVKIIK